METTTVSQLNCRNCGATVNHSYTECGFCAAPIRITTLKNVVSLEMAVALKLARAYEKDVSDEEAKLSLALLLLKLGQYDKAQKVISEAIEANPGNDELYLAQGIAALSGKKPFLCSRPAINIALQSVDAAFFIRELAVYKLFSAIVKFDYFKRKGFTILPDYKDDLAVVKSIGLASGDKEELLKLVRFDLVPEFQNNMED